MIREIAAQRAQENVDVTDVTAFQQVGMRSESSVISAGRVGRISAPLRA
jgi:hypothetical protein